MGFVTVMQNQSVLSQVGLSFRYFGMLYKAAEEHICTAFQMRSMISWATWVTEAEDAKRAYSHELLGDDLPSAICC